MQKIVPFLWFDNQAEEAVKFYVSLFENSKSGSVLRYGEAGPGPQGSVMTITFQLAGREFAALNGGPVFKFTPAISFFVNCETQKQLDTLWAKLGEGGMVLMELGQYPFSERFGWLADKYGVTWQLNLAGMKQTISPSLMFVREQHGRAEEAMKFYVSQFKDSSIKQIEHNPAGEGETAETVKLAKFLLHGQEFMAMDSGREHQFSFNEGLSFFVNCETPPEVDMLWEKMSEGGEKGECGWLKDKFGVSWQIVPTALLELLHDKDPRRSNNVMRAMLKMKRLDIAGLRRAYEEK